MINNEHKVGHSDKCGLLINLILKNVCILQSDPTTVHRFFIFNPFPSFHLSHALLAAVCKKTRSESSLEAGENTLRIYRTVITARELDFFLANETDVNFSLLFN